MKRIYKVEGLDLVQRAMIACSCGAVSTAPAIRIPHTVCVRDERVISSQEFSFSVADANTAHYRREGGFYYVAYRSDKEKGGGVHQLFGVDLYDFPSYSMREPVFLLSLMYVVSESEEGKIFRHILMRRAEVTVNQVSLDNIDDLMRIRHAEEGFLRSMIALIEQHQ